MKPRDWDDLRFLLAVAREGSLGGAARALGVDPTTVSRRLSSLEESVGARLVTRTPEGVRLTPEGEIAAASAEQMEIALLGIDRRLSGKDESPSGKVRLTSGDCFATYLMRELPEFVSRFPNVELELVADRTALDLARGEADVAVRFFRSSDESLVTKKLGDLGWSLYGSDSYLERKGAVDPSALGDHEIVGYHESFSGMPGANWLVRHAIDSRVVCRGNTMWSVAEAVAAGLGVSVLPCFLEVGELLIRRLTSEVLAVSEAFFVVHPDLKNVARVRAVSQFLTDLFARNRSLLAGHGPG